jgi:hypothetical protein
MVGSDRLQAQFAELDNPERERLRPRADEVLADVAV